MKCTLTNNSKQVLIVPLNSGAAVNLAPGETSDPLDEVETTDNLKIEKMTNAGLITLTQGRRRTSEESDSAQAERSPSKKTKA